jgi:hypothetical protein
MQQFRQVPELYLSEQRALMQRLHAHVRVRDLQRENAPALKDDAPFALRYLMQAMINHEQIVDLALLDKSLAEFQALIFLVSHRERLVHGYVMLHVKESGHRLSHRFYSLI